MTTPTALGDGWEAATLSSNGKVALSRQIARDLGDRIRSGDMAVGAELPSEADLAMLYGVHRLTIRQAMSDLAREGLVVTARGRRATVAPPPLRYRLDQVIGTSLASAMAQEGLAVTHDRIAVVEDTATNLPLPLGGAHRCVRFDYRRRVDDRPWSRSTTWVLPSLAPRDWRGSRPLLDVVAAQHRLDVRRATRCFSAIPAAIDDADLLDLPIGAPLLRVTGSSVDQDGRTIAVVRHHVIGDRAEYVLNLLT